LIAILLAVGVLTGPSITVTSFGKSSQNASIHDNKNVIIHPASVSFNGKNVIIHPTYITSKASSSSSCHCPKPSNITRTTTVMQQNITNIKGPVKIAFINSYWTYNTAQDQFVAGTTSARTSAANISPVIKQEVGPAEGPSLLAVVLINKGFSAITGITSSLELPQGFEPLITPKSSSIPGAQSQTALSSYDGVVDPGRAFTLYFGVNVLGNAQVGKQFTAVCNKVLFKPGLLISKSNIPYESFYIYILITNLKYRSKLV